MTIDETLNEKVRLLGPLAVVQAEPVMPAAPGTLGLPEGNHAELADGMFSASIRPMHANVASASKLNQNVCFCDIDGHAWIPRDLGTLDQYLEN